MKEITRPQAEALAQVLNHVRPDWGTQAIINLIGQHRTIAEYPALVIAAVTKAQEPSCRTPAPIFHPGPHWPTTAAVKALPPDYCRAHYGHERDTCPVCTQEIQDGYRKESERGQQLPADPPPPNLRQLIQQAKETP